MACVSESRLLTRFSVRVFERMSRYAEVTLCGARRGLKRRATVRSQDHAPAVSSSRGEPERVLRNRGVDSSRPRGIRDGSSRHQRFNGRARASRRCDRRALDTPRRGLRAPTRSDPGLRCAWWLEQRLSVLCRVALLARRPRSRSRTREGPRGARPRHAAAARPGARPRRAVVRQGPRPHARGDSGHRGEVAGHRPRRHGRARGAHRPWLAVHGSQSGEGRSPPAARKPSAPRVSE